MKKCYPGLLLILLCGTAFAQKPSKIDSLQKLLRTSKVDTVLSKAAVQLGWAYWPSGKYDSVLKYEQLAIATSEKYIPNAHDSELFALKRYKGAGYQNIGNVYYMRADYPQSIRNYQLALAVNQEINYRRGIAKAYAGLGNDYTQQGIYSEALNNYYAGLKIHDELKDTIGMGAAYNNIGIVYNDQHRYDEALKIYRQCLALCEKAHDKSGIGRAYSNMGVAYEKQFKYTDALRSHQAALAINLALGDRSAVAAGYSNIGVIYGILGKQDSALANHYRSSAIRDSLKDMRGQAIDNVNIGVAYYKLGQLDTALPYMKRGLEIAQAIGNKELIMSSYQALSELYNARKEFHEAYQSYHNFITYRDSLINDENTQARVQAQMNYDFEKKATAEKEKRDHEASVQRIITWSIIGGLVLLVLLLLLFFSRQRLRQRSRHQEQLNQQQKAQASAVMETQEQERKRIAEDLHDSLGHLLSTVKLQLQTLPQEQQQNVQSPLQLLNQASEEIRNITFNLMPRTLEEGGLVAALNELAAKVNAAGTVHVSLNVFNIDHFVLEKQSQFNIYRIIQEAVNNILKHADAKEISIQLIGQDDHITIMIEDDGKGFDPSVQKSGRGLKNIVTRSLWLRGNINIDSSPGRGTTITTEIPV